MGIEALEELVEIAKILLEKYCYTKEAAIETWSSDISRDMDTLNADQSYYEHRIDECLEQISEQLKNSKVIVKGKWINKPTEDGRFTYKVCSICGFPHRAFFEFNYCTNCGAEMKGIDNG